jgi:hypothetical protein
VAEALSTSTGFDIQAEQAVDAATQVSGVPSNGGVLRPLAAEFKPQDSSGAGAAAAAPDPLVAKFLSGQLIETNAEVRTAM